MRSLKTWLIGLSAILIVGLVANRLRQPTPTVTTGTVSESQIKGSFTAEGVVKGKEYSLSPEVAGKVSWLGIREGETVAAGQVLLKVDSSQAEAVVRQSEAAVQTAQSSVREARAAYNLARDQIETRISQAAASERVAQARLDRVKKGARTQEIQVAEHRMEQLQAALTVAQRDFERAQSLYTEGAIAKASLDAAEAKYRSAQGEIEAQKDSLALLKEGPSHEEILEAQSAVEAAQADYAGAIKGRDELRMRADSIASAISRANEAREALRHAQTVLPKHVLRAPVGGVIVRLNAELGMMAGPSVAALSLGTRQDMRIEAEIGSEDSAKASAGMPVLVTSAAWPGRSFPGRIQSLSQVGELKPDAAIRTRIIRARVSLDEGFSRFKPGVEVDVEGNAVLKKALVVPSDAVSYEGTKTSVWVVEGDRVSQRPVTIGFADVDVTEIVSGLEKGAMVVVAGKDNLRNGEAVKVRR